MPHFFAEAELPRRVGGLRIMARLDRLDDLVREKLDHGQRDHAKQEPRRQQAEHQSDQTCQSIAVIGREISDDPVLDHRIERPPQGRAEPCENRQRQACGLREHAQDRAVAELGDRQGEGPG